jgi:hypothetical protein
MLILKTALVELRFNDLQPLLRLTQQSPNSSPRMYHVIRSSQLQTRKLVISAGNAVVVQ